MRSSSALRLLRISMATIAVAAGTVAFTVKDSRGFPLPPAGDAFFGVQLDYSHDTVPAYASRLGATPALYGRYVNFPLSKLDEKLVGEEARELSSRHSSLMLTLEPRRDLSAVTPAAVEALRKELTTWNDLGLPVLVRFAHEMNGSWYPWAQQPALYVQKFREVAAAVHRTPASSMLWSPNEGGGYPYTGGPYGAKRGSSDFVVLDTNHDGKLSMEDDPYRPYWPGDDAVDWVGLSVYHFGAAYPWGRNVMPEPGKLIAKVTGTFKSGSVDETALPDFYQTYAVGHHKPFAISETGAFYNTARQDGASADAIKQAWWRQSFSPAVLQRFPELKLVAWFEFAKNENEPGHPYIDWRVTADPGTRNAFKEDMSDHFLMAPLR